MAIQLTIPPAAEVAVVEALPVIPPQRRKGPGRPTIAAARAKEEALASMMVDIKRHLGEHGPRHWKYVMDKYPDVSRRAFVKQVERVRNGIPKPEDVRGAVAHAKRLAMAKGHMPAVPSPHYIAAAGARGKSNFDFMEKFNQLVEDAELVRDWASRVDENGVRAIKNPHFFIMSIKLQVDLMETQLKAMREVYDLQRMQNFFDAIVKEVADESPEVAARIMDRLSKLNAEYGMNTNIRV